MQGRTIVDQQGEGMIRPVSAGVDAYVSSRRSSGAILAPDGGHVPAERDGMKTQVIKGRMATELRLQNRQREYFESQQIKQPAALKTGRQHRVWT
jgi:hypothetical protein